VAATLTRRPELDGVRAIAALSVLVFHAVGFYARGSGEEAAIRPWVGRLDVGVSIFFLLSGYLLYKPFVRGHVLVGRYAWRRALRIVPGYWVALTVAALVLPLSEVWDHPLRFYGFAQTYWADTAGEGLGQAWTLCVEVAFYAFLPLWAAVVAARGKLWTLAALAAASVLYKLAVLAGSATQVGPLEPPLIALPAFLDQFALGMALAVLEVRGTRIRGGWWWWVGAVALFAAVSLLLRDARLDAYTHAQWMTRETFYGLIAGCVLAGALSGGGPVRILSSWPLRRLGEISYGIYLYHLFVLALLSRWGLSAWERWVHPYLLWTAFALAGSVALATASWVLVERRLLRAGARRWSTPASPSPSPAPREPRR
jgi:peptidoglycan/LPS O-acetylase OafA/YrhL